MWTVGELLAWTQGRFTDIGIGSPRLDAELLLADAMGCDRMQLYVRHDQVVPKETKDAFRALVKRRLQREPVAYIQGKKGFHALDLELAVDRRVLVPRPETEHLVDWLLEELRPPPAPSMFVLDVGTGSGAIALAVKRAREEVEVTGSDISEDALTVAAANGQSSGLSVSWVRSDLLGDVQHPEGGWTAIAANLPYIPSADFEGLQPEVTEHEPRGALDGGTDGLDFVRRLVEQAAAPGVLAPAGALYLEIGAGQASATADLLRQAGFEDVQARRDYADIERVVRGFAPRRG
jgi:release factor glutamine methyltransferase